MLRDSREARGSVLCVYCLNSVLVFFSSISEDSSRMFVAVGYGFFVEMTHDEALRFIEKKTSQLTAWVHCHCNTIKIKSRRKKHKKINCVSDMFQMKVRISLCCEIIWKKYVRTIYFVFRYFWWVFWTSMILLLILSLDISQVFFSHLNFPV